MPMGFTPCQPKSRMPKPQLLLRRCCRWRSATRNEPELLPQLDAAFAPQNHGFDDARDAIRAIYADWLEIKKAGRGERVRHTMK